MVMGVGVPELRFTLNEKKAAEGTLFSKEHYDSKSFVAVVNETFKSKFFKNGSAIGKKFIYNGKEFTIVGVLPKQEYDR
jgi:hypothetical protein